MRKWVGEISKLDCHPTVSSAALTPSITHGLTGFIKTATADIKQTGHPQSYFWLLENKQDGLNLAL